TGQHIPREVLAQVLGGIPRQTRVWIDEAYTDYAGPAESVEAVAAASQNGVVCKSLSKTLALSGARAAYLCAPARIAVDLRSITPPWAISLPAQVATVTALRSLGYYRQRWQETGSLREGLAAGLRGLGLSVISGAINSVLCRLPDKGP